MLYRNELEVGVGEADIWISVGTWAQAKLYQEKSLGIHQSSGNRCLDAQAADKLLKAKLEAMHDRSHL